MRIQTRKSWNARRPRDTTRQNDSQIKELFLHYPASPHDLGHIDRDQEQDAYMRQIQDFHMDVRGWSDFAYNFAVFQDGRVYRGRGRNVVPAAQFGHNTGTIAVLCVVGNDEKPTQRMVEALRDLKNLMDRRVGRDLWVRAHGDVFATSCPGPHLRAIVPTLQRS
jgi:hypothetical protein